MVGLRHCLYEEFTSLYVLNMRGDQRTSGELSRREGGKLFGGGSRAPISIVVFVKDPSKTERGRVHYHDIGDYLTREEKLARLAAFANDQQVIPWARIKPDQYGDWINQRDPEFDRHIVMGDKKNKAAVTVFRSYSNGLATGRDAWVYNASQRGLKQTVRGSLQFYNAEVERYSQDGAGIPAARFVEKDPTRFSWDGSRYKWVERGKRIEFQSAAVQLSLYRPFCKQWAYYSRAYNHSVYRLPSVFPRSDLENRLICTTSTGDKEFASLMVSTLPDRHLIGFAECFPKYIYAELASGGYERLPNITESALSLFQEAYPQLNVDADLLFDYIYGLLHSPDYRERFSKNLLKQLPRIPAVTSVDDFRAFAHGGKELGDLHVNYEEAELYPALINGKPIAENNFTDDEYRVEKMCFAGKRGSDRSTVIYNHRITVSGIPDEAYEYSVNGKTPVGWVMDRQRVTVHKASQIKNDSNQYAVETVGDAAYPLKLLLRAVTVGIETARIVSNLPTLKLRD